MVLVVDDNREICDMLIRVLRLSKVDGHCELGGQNALAWLREHRPELVILDVSMPDISGIDVLKMIKSDPHLHGIPVVLHSAFSDQTVAQVAEENGADGMLLKGRYGISDVLNLIHSFGVKGNRSAGLQTS